MLRTAAILAAVLAVLATPALAQEAPQSNLGQGLDKLREGTAQILEGLKEKAGPALQGLKDDLGTLIDDASAYEAPEVQPNGDILIRRKVPRTVPPPDVPTPDALPDTDTETGPTNI